MAELIPSQQANRFDCEYGAQAVLLSRGRIVVRDLGPGADSGRRPRNSGRSKAICTP
ncbi:hypothetical protein [Streptomyces sp. NBC_01615]|uniref:hypothetical protein n=1 Tax=Streptomyces sp. NBC_01615 TaxID=2975898 RepID=UPI0038689E1D